MHHLNVNMPSLPSPAECWPTGYLCTHALTMNTIHDSRLWHSHIIRSHHQSSTCVHKQVEKSLTNVTCVASFLLAIKPHAKLPTHTVLNPFWYQCVSCIYCIGQVTASEAAMVKHVDSRLSSGILNIYVCKCVLRTTIMFGLTYAWGLRVYCTGTLVRIGLLLYLFAKMKLNISRFFQLSLKVLRERDVYTVEPYYYISMHTVCSLLL